MFACVYVAECGVGQVCLSVCVCGVVHVRLCVCVVCGVGQVRLCVCSLCVSYVECEVGVDLLERVSVVLGRSAGVYVCVWCRACLPVRMWLSVVSDRSVCLCVCGVCVWCGVRQVRLCMCVIHGMPSSCRSAGESECVVLGRSACVCVCVCACVCAVCVCLCVWCLAGPSVCVIREILSSCRSAGQSE